MPPNMRPLEVSARRLAIWPPIENLDAVRVQEPDARGIGDLGFHKKSLRLFFCGLRVIVCVGDLAKNSYSARDKPDQFNGIQHDLLLLSAKHIGVEGWIRYRGQARQMSKSGFYRAAEVVIADAAINIAGPGYEAHLRNRLCVGTRPYKHVRADLSDLTFRLLSRGVEFHSKRLAG